MRVLSIDWATRKALKIFDSQTNKIKDVPNTEDAFQKILDNLDGEKITMLFEFGGGDIFKIMSFRAGHIVLQVPGKKVKDYRDSKSIEKSDEADARAIYDLYMENGGRVRQKVRNISDELPPSSENKGGGARCPLDKNLIRDCPPPSENQGETMLENQYPTELTFPCSSSFSPFREADADIAEVKVLFREHENLKQVMVREKNKLFAFEQKFRIAQVADDRVKKIRENRNQQIVLKERELEQLKKVLEKKVKGFRVWDRHLKGLKAVGPVIAAGLIGELGGRRFDDESSLKHYAGMVPKSEFHDYNRYVKMILFQFAEQVIRQKTPEWRELYDGIKKFYAEKHPDWSKGKVNNYAKKFIETKFLKWFWKKWEECG